MNDSVKKLTGYFLVVETSMLHCSACIAFKNEVLATYNFSGNAQHASSLMQGVYKMFQELQITASDLSAVCISIGPGSYTGLRIGMASMKGLVYPGKIPFYGFSTLQAMALAGAQKANHKQYVLAIMDARRLNVYAGLFHANGEVVWNNLFINLTELSYSDTLTGQDRFLLTGNNLSEHGKFFSTNRFLKYAVDSDISPYVSLIIDSKLRLTELDPLSAEPLYLKSPHITTPGSTKI